jgi:hypothetical protein
MHENFTREQPSNGPSDRSFGLTFAILFAIIGLAPLARHHSVRGWALVISAAIILVSLARPAALHPANRIWMQFAAILNRIVSPIVMGLIFLFVVFPIGLILRFLGKDPLRRRFDPQATTYWIPRQPPGPPPESMSRQF